MQKEFKVAGMHCRSCEIIIEDKIKNIPGVKKVNASTKKKLVFVQGDFDGAKVEEAIRKAGYEVGEEKKQENKWRDLFIASFVILGFYLLYRIFGLERVLNIGLPESSNLGLIFLLGITAGVSTCMALVGGLVLSVSARYVEKHPEQSPIQKFRPHLFFNLGRILGYFALGGLIGVLGGALKLPTSFYGFMAIVVGFVMLFLGFKILEIFPRLSNLLTLPKSFQKFTFRQKEKEYSHTRSTILGALTFFMPCGFTQAMQVLAITSGSFGRGALIMGIFALGTTPGLLSIGGLTSFVKKSRFYGLFMRFVGVLVIVLAFTNILNGYWLTGFSVSNLFTKEEEAKEEEWRIIYGPKSNQEPQDGAPVNTNVQVIKATYDQRTVLTPREFNVKVGQPVRLEIFAQEDGLGCMGSVMIPGLVDDPKFFTKGETVVLEFIPKKTGMYRITCAMGVPAGKIYVK